MRTACFVRVLQRCTGRLYMNFLSIFQAVRPIGKTRNQLNPSGAVTPVLVVTTDLSDVVRMAANELGVRVEHIALQSDYPMIKCNINRSTGERIYHLPFDQQYDRVRIVGSHECYVRTVEEAEKLGFRRAWRFKGIAQTS